MNTKKRTARIHKLWSKDQIGKLEELLAEETPIPEIATTLKKTVKAIRRKCDSLNLSSATTYRANQTEKKYARIAPSQGWSPEEDRVLIELTLANKSILEICKALNRTYHSVATRRSDLRKKKAITHWQNSHQTSHTEKTPPEQSLETPIVTKKNAKTIYALAKHFGSRALHANALVVDKLKEVREDWGQAIESAIGLGKIKKILSKNLTKILAAETVGGEGKERLISFAEVSKRTGISVSELNPITTLTVYRRLSSTDYVERQNLIDFLKEAENSPKRTNRNTSTARKALQNQQREEPFPKIKFRNGKLREAIIKLLSRKGAKGMHNADIAAALGREKNNIQVWYSQGGKHIPGISKPQPGYLAYNPKTA